MFLEWSTLYYDLHCLPKLGMKAINAPKQVLQNAPQNNVKPYAKTIALN